MSKPFKASPTPPKRIQDLPEQGGAICVIVYFCILIFLYLCQKLKLLPPNVHPQNMLIYAFIIDCRELHLLTFCRKIHRFAKIGVWGGVKQPILAMP